MLIIIYIPWNSVAGDEDFCDAGGESVTQGRVRRYDRIWGWLLQKWDLDSACGLCAYGPCPADASLQRHGRRCPRPGARSGGPLRGASDSLPRVGMPQVFSDAYITDSLRSAWFGSPVFLVPDASPEKITLVVTRLPFAPCDQLFVAELSWCSVSTSVLWTWYFPSGLEIRQMIHFYLCQ